ncbi:MAG TPA: arsenic resistance protein [Candidatus Korarchaeota archaeon]|nr:arsenic resistance protein [Candidatus Korarchaeota archaeon]
MRKSVAKAAAHMKKYLLLYSILAIVIGIIIGYRYHIFFKIHKDLIKNIIISLAILTIYPSMIQLKLERIGIAAKKIKAIVLSMFYIFVLSPITAIAFSTVIPNTDVAMGYVVSNVVPASSASIGYVLLVDGDIELATVLAVLSLFGSLIAVPGYLNVYSSVTSASVPLGKTMEALVYTLVIPFILGQVTRYLAIRHTIKKKREEYRPNGKDGTTLAHELEEDFKLFERKIVKELESSIKPHLSLATMISMLVLICMLAASKAFMMINSPNIAFMVIGLQAVMLFMILGVVTVSDRSMHMSYSEHEAIAFISATKNQSVAAAIAVMALGPGAALVPALVPAIQAPVAIAYVNLSDSIRKMFGGV